MRILEHGDISFGRDDAGNLNCRLADGTFFTQAHCISLFPISMPEKFISVVQGTEHDLEEIGIIEELGGFPPEQREMIRAAISERYFVPEILDIVRLDRRHGIYEWDVITDRGPTVFYQVNPKENLSFNNAGVLIVSDMDKCRFKISGLEKLPHRAKALMEQVLV